MIEKKAIYSQKTQIMIDTQVSKTTEKTWNKKKGNIYQKNPKSSKDLVILGDLDNLGDLCSILHFFTSIIFPLHIYNILIEKKSNI